MLYTVFVAICLAGMNPAECDRHTAVEWVATPEPAQGLGMCAMTGIEYAAEQHLLRAGTYPKVFCSSGGGEPAQEDLT
jgi:hypothetical protein